MTTTPPPEPSPNNFTELRPLRQDELGTQPGVDRWTDADLAHVTGMVDKPGLFLRLFAWIFFKPVTFPVRQIQDLKELSQEGVLVYTMRTTSLLDYLYFNYVFRDAELPLAHFSNGASMLAFQPWRRAISGWFRRRVLRRPQPPEIEVLFGHLRRKHAVLLFLHRVFSLLDLINPKSDTPYLAELIEAQRTLPFPIFLAPQLLVWQRDPERSRTRIIDEFFGDPDAPGRIRKLLSFILNHRRAFVQSGEPVNVREFLTSQPSQRDDRLLAELLRLRIDKSFQTEQRVIRGAPIKPPKQLREEILNDPEVMRDIAALSYETKRSITEVRAEANENLKEIAADYSMGMLSALSLFLTLLWARIYEGIEVDEDGMERIREAGRKSPIVIVPSHKSHIDYLLISYLFYRNGLIPPHIAAGANLSFFPLGVIFRGSGAFFLRRSFHGQPIYASIFRHYFRKLIRDGHWLEFFLEGGRSRTGKLLPPKFGLLKHVLEAVADGLQPDVVLMPTNFGYERLIEEKAYRKELEGGEKKAESPVEVLKATSVLVHKYGRIRIQFGQPMSVRELLAENNALMPAATRDPKAFDRALKVCGYRILGGINAAAVITPTSIVSAVLLTKVQRGIARNDLLVRVGYLLDVASRRGAVLSDPLKTALRNRRAYIVDAETADLHRHAESGGIPEPLGKTGERSRRMGQAVEGIVDEVLKMFEAAKWVHVRRFDDQDIYITKTEGRLHLDYYKNNMLHLFVPDALLASSVLALQVQADELDPQELSDMTKFLSRLLKFEFVYAPGVSFEQMYQGTLEAFEESSWLVVTANGKLRLRPTVLPVIRLYAKLVQNFIESYALMGRALSVLQKGPMAEKDFLEHVQNEAAKAFELGGVQCYEAVSRVNLGNALKIFVEQAYVRSYSEGSGKKRVKMLTVKHGEGTGAQLAGYVQRIRDLAAPWGIDR